jgi:hypothetical protein
MRPAPFKTPPARPCGAQFLRLLSVLPGEHGRRGKGGNQAADRPGRSPPANRKSGDDEKRTQQSLKCLSHR